MLKKALVAAALTAASSAALAHPPHWAPAYGYRAPVRYYHPPVRYYYPAAPRVVYRPVPVYPVAPVVVAAPRVVIPAPIAPGIVVRLHFPL
jgi:hypothetical protein